MTVVTVVTAPAEPAPTPASWIANHQAVLTRFRNELDVSGLPHIHQLHRGLRERLSGREIGAVPGQSAPLDQRGVAIDREAALARGADVDEPEAMGHAGGQLERWR